MLFLMILLIGSRGWMKGCISEFSSLIFLTKIWTILRQVTKHIKNHWSLVKQMISLSQTIWIKSWDKYCLSFTIISRKHFKQNKSSFFHRNISKWNVPQILHKRRHWKQYSRKYINWNIIFLCVYLDVHL